MLGLSGADGVSEKSLEGKNGQVVLLTAGDWFASQHNFAVEQKDAQKAQWQQEAEHRLARIEAKKSPLQKAEDGLTEQKFAWSKDGQKSFEWRKIYHALVGPGVGGMPDGGIITETVFNPTVTRMYTDHRVMGQIVLPGVSHISLAAAVASVGMEGTGFKRNEFSINVHETFFERPYLVNDGKEIIEAVAARGGDTSGIP